MLRCHTIHYNVVIIITVVGIRLSLETMVGAVSHTGVSSPGGIGSDTSLGGNIF